MTSEIEDVLSENLKALMAHHRIGSQTALARKAGIDQTSVGRMLRAPNAAQIDKVTKVAHAFGLCAWQILVPGLDPANPPVYLSTTERNFYDKIKRALAES